MFLCDSIESTAPQIILHHYGNDDWFVTLDCGTKLKLRIGELTSYRRFRWAALMQANRLFPEMSNAEWRDILTDTMHRAKLDVMLLAR